MNDWVKLPQITNQPKPPYKIQSVTTLADLTSSSSALANSDVLSSVFSYDSSKINTTTITAVPLVTHAPTSSLKKPLMTTVTSKTVNFVHDISDRVDREELMMEPVKLVPTHKESRKVLNMNQTVPMKVSVESGKKLKDTDEDDDDEGVTVLDEDEELVSSEEVEYYYEYEEDAEALTTSTTTTTTRAPRKTTRRPSLTKPTSQRRVSQVPKSKPLLQSSLSFSNFFKFIKNIQSSFTTRTAKNINDKIKMLREFRDSLLLTINQRIKTLWKTQAKTKQNKKQRSKRTLGGGDSGGWMDQGAGMAFPSAEGALLSISFLTFAVFLIKLVLVRQLNSTCGRLCLSNYLNISSFSKWFRRLKWRSTLITICRWWHPLVMEFRDRVWS